MLFSIPLSPSAGTWSQFLPSQPGEQVQSGLSDKEWGPECHSNESPHRLQTQNSRVNILRSILPSITKEDLGLEWDFKLCKKQGSDNRKSISKRLRGDRLLGPLLWSGTQSPARTPTFCPVNQLTSLFWPSERLPFLGIPTLDEEGKG